MPVETTTGPAREPVIQFGVFTPNRLGRLHDLVRLLASKGIHVLALMVVDATDSAIIRVVVDNPEGARELLRRDGFTFTETKLVVVEANATDLGPLMAALLEVELNINYLYSFIPQPNGKALLGMNLEDTELAEQALQRHQFRTLRQADISR